MKAEILTGVFYDEHTENPTLRIDLDEFLWELGLDATRENLETVVCAVRALLERLRLSVTVATVEVWEESEVF